MKKNLHLLFWVISSLCIVSFLGLTPLSEASQRAEMQIILKPKPDTKDTWIINQVTATGNTSVTSTSGTAPNAENCQGKYSLNNSINKNFGDPNCNFTTDALATQLRTLDGANAELWYQVARCESGHNPNAWRDPNIIPKTPDPAGAWGLFQMGSSTSGPGTPGNGRNGPYDRGDVDWPQQITNAVEYYKTVLYPSGLGIAAYWACAR